MTQMPVAQKAFRFGGALLVAAGLLVGTHAVPTFADRPAGADCQFVTPGFYDCTTSDGHEWYCTDPDDVTACQQVKFAPDEGSIVFHPVTGGIFDPGSSSYQVAPRVPAGAIHVEP